MPLSTVLQSREIIPHSLRVFTSRLARFKPSMQHCMYAVTPILGHLGDHGGTIHVQRPSELCMPLTALIRPSDRNRRQSLSAAIHSLRILYKEPNRATAFTCWCNNNNNNNNRIRLVGIHSAILNHTHPPLPLRINSPPSTSGQKLSQSLQMSRLPSDPKRLLLAKPDQRRKSMIRRFRRCSQVLIGERLSAVIVFVSLITRRN
ncbi:hypothetical protein PGTUg99_024599 [Puccinia graminis f. sp. tritici]|uniref:Uncharacterized protein n=1 Tax=Puccinia graminis f. sp. tritici TaxID=56615 RepID=A0A5B0REI7_PUCGR|nr:hypothetical protein PGTUg99_024599 [Puccinia graminis f. sp. tritici]